MLKEGQMRAMLVLPLLFRISDPQLEKGSVVIVAVSWHLFCCPLIHLQQGKALAPVLRLCNSSILL